MRRIPITLITLLLLTAFLALPGCAGTREAQKAAAPAPAPENQPHASLAQYAEPDFLFTTNARNPTKTLRVKAMAYTACAVGKKKKSKPVRRATRGAWGDELTPGIKAVAVSPDLLDMGLEHGDVIAIEGLPGQYKVLDVMHGRHDRSIDIFYGDDACGAIEWGKRTLTISWQ